MTLLKVDPKSYVNGWISDILNDFPFVVEKTFTERSFVPQVNIKETADAYLLQLSAPGRTKEDFKINLEKNLLTISSEHKAAEHKENEKQIRNEFTVGAFKRTFTVDDKIEAEKIEAKYENGLLSLTLPKKAEVKPEVKEISIQ